MANPPQFSFLIHRLGGRWSAAVKFTRRHRGPFFISLGVCMVSIALYVAVYLVRRPTPWFFFLRSIELQTLDARFRIRGPRPPDPRIVIVAIDQKSEDVLGRWPFPRSNFAEALDYLREAHAAVVAYDVSFPQPDENSALRALQALRTACAAGHGGSQCGPKMRAQLAALEASADNDRKFAQALSRFDNAVLGYYLLFSEKETQTENKQLVSEFLNYLSFQAYPSVSHPEYGRLFQCPYCEAVGVYPTLPLFAQYAKNFGFFNVVPDPDGTVRKEPVIVRFEGSYYPSLDVAAVLAYTNRSLEQVSVVFNPNGLERIDFGPTAIPTDPDGEVQIDFHGPAQTYPTYSLADVVQHRAPPSAFEGRIVIVGATATGIGDMIPTPFQTMAFPGPEVHANFIDNLLHGDFVRRGERENLTDLGFLLLFSLPVGILLSVVAPVRATAVVAAILALFLWWTYHVFAADRVWLAEFLPSLTLILNHGSIVTYRYFFEEREKRQVRSTFQQYLSPAVIRQLLEQPELVQLGGEEKELTVMFTDIRGFTSISEQLSPTALVQLLNEYLSEMTGIIFKHRGTLDKYIGDAVMAFWGAPYPQPNHAELACRAGLEMHRVLKESQARWRAEGRHPIEIGVGINTGTMLMGNMGSQQRFNFTIIGDNVNLASRLEGLNKYFGTRLIVSENTYQAVKDAMLTRRLDWIRVKGKKKPVTIYEVLDERNGTSAERLRLVERFEAGLEHYRLGKWREALEQFGDCLRDFPEDGPTRVFIDRCWALVQEPPEEAWEGVYVMKSK
jgi:adenylate cyclase